MAGIASAVPLVLCMSIDVCMSMITSVLPLFVCPLYYKRKNGCITELAISITVVFDKYLILEPQKHVQWIFSLLYVYFSVRNVKYIKTSQCKYYYM